MEEVGIRAQDLRRVEDEALQLLPRRVHRIDRGHIGQEHWFLAIVKEAVEIVRRSRMWEARRRS